MKPKLLRVTASELVILAVHELESMKLHNSGPTFKDILELILNKYQVNNHDLMADVREALLRGVTFGIFDEKEGRYRLEDVPEPPLELKSSQDSVNEPQVTSAMTVPSNSTRKKKTEDGGREMRTLFKRKTNCRECGRESKRSRMKSESESEENEQDVEEEYSY